MAKRAVVVVLVLGLVAALVVVSGVLDAGDSSDEERSRLERRLSSGPRCPGEPPPRVTCRARNGGYDCEVGDEKVRVEDPDHLEFSIIC